MQRTEQKRRLLKVPYDAGAVEAGRDALFVILAHAYTRNCVLVLLQREQ